MLRMPWCLVVFSVLTGCSPVEESLMKVPEKVNAAYPVSTETRVAFAELEAMLNADAAEQAKVRGEFDARLALRGKTCAEGRPIGRFDSIAKVRSSGLDPTCLVRQEAAISDWLGMRRLGPRLALPALSPFKALGSARAMSGVGMARTLSMATASQAGIAVLVHITGDYTVIEIPSGKKVSTIPNLTDVVTDVSVSPNGRVVAFEVGGRLIAFFDARTGSRIWQTTLINGFKAWLPQLSAALVNRRDDQALMLLDMRRGELVEHPLAMRNRLWALPHKESPSQVLIGAGDEIALVEQRRTAEGIQASLVKEIRLTGKAVHLGAPTPMKDGRLLVYSVDHDIAWVDLEAEEEGLWSTESYVSNAFAKLSESTLLLETLWNDPRMPGQRHMFNVDDATIAEVKQEGGETGYLQALGGRTGYVRVANAFWLGDAVTTGPPRALDAAVTEMGLQKQLLKAKEQVAALGADSAQSRGGATSPAALLPDVPPDARLHVVGAYEGGAATGVMVDGHKQKEISVSIRTVGQPLVLVLSSYEPVRWSFTQGGGQISAILLSGYHQSSVIGAGSTRVIRIGNEYAYLAGSPEHQKLKNSISSYVTLPIRSFQGSYTASSFAVGP